MTLLPKCTDGLGFTQNHDAEGWLVSPRGRRIVAMCRRHADAVITEYDRKICETWTFEAEAEAGQQ